VVAGRSEELRTNLTVNDQASKPIDAVADKLEALEKAEPEVTLSADDKASAEVDELARKLSLLSNDDKLIVLKAQAKQAEQEIARIERQFANIDRMSDEEIVVRVEARDMAKAKLDDVQAKLRELDGETVDVEVKSSSIGSLIGQVGDLDGKLSGVLGTAGKLAGPAALGALGAGLLAAGDYAATLAVEAGEVARLTGDSVTAAGQLNAVWRGAGFDVKDLQDVILQLNGVLASSPELAAQIGVNLDDGKTAGERFVEVTRKLETNIKNATQRGVLGSQLFGEEGVRQVNAVLLRVGELDKAMAEVDSAISQEDVDQALAYQKTLADVKAEVTAVAGEIGTELLPALRAIAELTGVLADGLGEKNPFRFTRHPDDDLPKEWAADYTVLTDAIVRAADATPPWTERLGEIRDRLLEARDAQAEHNAEAERAEPLIDAVADVLAEARDRTREAEDATRDARIALYDYLNQYDELRDDIAGDNTWLDLQTSFDNVRTKAEEAWIATAEGAADAEQKSRDYQRSLNDIKLDTLDYVENVAKLPREVVTRITSLLDRGSVDEVERQLEIIARNRTMELSIIARGGNAFGTGARHVGGRVGPGDDPNVQRGEMFYRDGPLSQAGRVAPRSEVAATGGGGVTVLTVIEGNVYGDAHLTRMLDERDRAIAARLAAGVRS
jgi:hypothetical protein